MGESGGGLSELACLLCLTARGNRCHGQHETRWNDRDGEKGFEAGGGTFREVLPRKGFTVGIGNSCGVGPSAGGGKHAGRPVA